MLRRLINTAIPRGMPKVPQALVSKVIFVKVTRASKITKNKQKVSSFFWQISLFQRLLWQQDTQSASVELKICAFNGCCI